MANAPAYFSTIDDGSVAFVPASTLDASPPVGTGAQTLVTANTSTGTKVEEIDVAVSGTSVAGLVYIWLYDGSAYHLRDTIPITAATASTTAASFQASRTYSNLFVPHNWS